MAFASFSDLAVENQKTSQSSNAIKKSNNKEATENGPNEKQEIQEKSAAADGASPAEGTTDKSETETTQETTKKISFKNKFKSSLKKASLIARTTRKQLSLSETEKKNGRSDLHPLETTDKASNTDASRFPLQRRQSSRF